MTQSTHVTGIIHDARYKYGCFPSLRFLLNAIYMNNPIFGGNDKRWPGLMSVNYLDPVDTSYSSLHSSAELCHSTILQEGSIPTGIHDNSSPYGLGHSVTPISGQWQKYPLLCVLICMMVPILPADSYNPEAWPLRGTMIQMLADRAPAPALMSC